MGPFLFGTPRDEIGDYGERDEFVRSKEFDDSPIDDLTEVGVQLNYDKEMKLEFIETYPPAFPAFKGVAFFSKSAQEVVAEMQELGIEHKKLDAGIDFPSVGINLYIPDEETIEAVGAYRKGYYE